MMEIGQKRFVRVSEFKGKVRIDIREYYTADDELKPGKKGTHSPCDSVNVTQ